LRAEAGADRVHQEVAAADVVHHVAELKERLPDGQQPTSCKRDAASVPHPPSVDGGG
jgi:bacterioferritin-associated ferredoxin